MVDVTQFTYKIEFNRGYKRMIKYYHKEKAVLKRYKKEKDNNPIMFFWQDGKWFGFDKNMG